MGRRCMNGRVLHEWAGIALVRRGGQALPETLLLRYARDNMYLVTDYFFTHLSVENFFAQRYCRVEMALDQRA
jgi:hypothetical protein